MPLHAELLIPLMFRFSADVGHVGSLVFKDVEDFALHCGPLEFVARKRGVELLLFCRLRSATRKPAVESNDVVLFVSMLAHPAKKMMPQAAKMRIRLDLVILVFMVRCVLTGCGLQ